MIPATRLVLIGCSLHGSADSGNYAVFRQISLISSIGVIYTKYTVLHTDPEIPLFVFTGGFSYFDPQKKRLVPFYNGLGSRDWRFSNKIHSAFSDKQGNLWMCTHSKGLEKVTYRNVPFSMMTPVPQEYESLHNEIRALCEDKTASIRVYPQIAVHILMDMKSRT